MNDQVSITDFLQRAVSRPVQVLLERGVERSSTAAGLCRRLEGRCLQLDPGAPALKSYFCVVDGELRLQQGEHEAPDAVLAGTPISLVRLAGPDPQKVMREGDVSISGDTEVAEQFQYLLQLVKPDAEEELSKVTGDAIAFEVGNVARGLAGWADTAAVSLNRSMAEYLTEESRVLVTRVEADEFCAAVDTLSADVDRLEARLRILRDAPESD